MPLKIIPITNDCRSNDERTGSMSEYGGHLYIGTRNCEEGAQLLKMDPSGSMTNVLRLEMPNMEIYGLVEFNGYLYFGTYNTNGGELYRLHNGSKPEKLFERGLDDPHNKDIWSLANWKEYLYIGTWNDMNGSKIYRTRNGVEFDCIFDTRDASKDYLRQMIAWRGGLFASFGKRCVPLQLLHIDETGYIRYMTTPMPPPRGDIYTMCLFQDRIYMGVSAYHRANETGGCEVWTYDGTRFERCSRPGFGNPNNEYIHSMVVFKDTLVCGVYNYKEGCELWATKDGHEWCCLSNNGFRLGTANETIAYSLCSYTDRLYVGTSNTAQGFGMYAIDKGALDAIFDHRFNR